MLSRFATPAKRFSIRSGIQLSGPTCRNCLSIGPRAAIYPSIAYFQSRHMSSDLIPKGDIGFRKVSGEDSATRTDEETLALNDDSIFDREYVEMNVVDFEELYKDDQSIKDKIATILSEYEYTKYDSIGRVPSVITVKDMKMLLDEGHNVTSRSRLIHYLFRREMDKRQTERKRQRDKELTRIRREAREQEFASVSTRRSGLLSDDGNLMYGLWHNSLFARIPENKMKNGLSTSRLCAAAQFGRKLIFDFGYEGYMNKHACRNSVDQVQEAYGLNRFDYREPMDFWFCNFDKNSYTGQYCEKYAMKNLHSGSMITVTPDCMTNHFDKSQLVYLSPNAKERLGQISKSDDIYVIGVFNDKGNTQPISLRKANKMGIRVKSLPIDEYLLWQGPSKALCINHVAGILLEVLANGGDWHAAFTKHIPPRKIKPSEIVQQEEQRRAQRISAKKKPFSLRFDFD